MTILAFDTCFGACSVALRWRTQAGEWLLREDYQEMSTGHAEALPPMIDRLMTATSTRFADLKLLAVTAGPGSFTGVRIGLSAVRGFKLALGLPVVTQTSLVVLAARAEALLASGQFGVTRAGSTLASCMDARGGHIYAEIFGDSLTERKFPAALWRPEELAQRLLHQRIVAVGSGAAMLTAAITAQGGDATAVLPLLQPHSRFLALVADTEPASLQLNPLYLRETDAKPILAPALP